MNNNQHTTAPLGRIKRLLFWPSGAIPSVLALCPSEQNYFCALGTLVWFTSSLAGCGMALMLDQTGGSRWIAIGGGMFWFLCVLNLDRFLLIASHENNGWKRLMPVARILLSLCIAIIIGEHVVQYIFHSEINYRLTQEGLEAKRTNYEKALQGFPAIGVLNEEKKRKQSDIDRKETEVGKLRTDYINEAEGTAGSRIRGKGQLYEQKKKDYETALSDKQKLQAELLEIDHRLDASDGQLRGVAQLADEAKASERGFLAYHRALFEIIRRDPTLLLLYVVISLAMILFEITPLISKLSGKGKLHDHLAEKNLELRKSEEDERHRTQLQRFRNETESKTRVAEKILQLQLDTLDEVTKSIRSDSHSGLSKEKLTLAESIVTHVCGNIIAQVKPNSADIEAGETDSSPETGFFSLDSPSSVTVVIKDEEPFTIVFRNARGNVQTRDLIYALAGLEQHRPAGTQPRVPLHQCRATNSHGEVLDPRKPLFSQISDSDNKIYLLPFEPTVSTAEN